MTLPWRRLPGRRRRRRPATTGRLPAPGRHLTVGVL